MVLDQNLVMLFYYVFGEDTSQHFPLLNNFSKQSQKFSHFSVKLKNQNKKLQSGSNILAFSKTDWANYLLYVSMYSASNAFL